MDSYGPVIVKPSSDASGLWVAWTPLFGLFSRGLWSQGRTEKEVKQCLRAGIALYLKHRCRTAVRN